MIDEIALMRAADPAAGVGQGPLDARAQADLDRILLLDASDAPHAGGIPRSGRARPRRGAPARRHGRARRRATLVVALVAVVIVIVAGFVVLNPWGVGSGPAYAAAPKILLVTAAPTESSAAVTDRLARAALAQTSGPSSRGSSFEQWSLNSRIDGRVVHSAVVPTEVDLRWNADASGHERVVVGNALPANATTGSGRTGDFLKAGTVVADNSFRVGGYPAMFPTAPPSGATALSRYLTVGHPASGGTAELFAAVTDLRQEWHVNGASRAALLHLLGQAPGITVLGSVRDRLGRPGLALSTESSMSGLPTRYVLVLDVATGDVIDSEQWLMTSAGALDVRVPSVIAYTAFR
jgi:hypothetical protein